MLFKRWKTNELRINKVVELKRSEWPYYPNKFDRPSKDGSQVQFLNKLMLRKAEMLFVVND